MVAMEIVQCVYTVSKKIYSTVDEVQANKKRCKRLADRIRCLVTPLRQLMDQGGNETVYKEALIDLVRTLEEARLFLKTFVKTKSVLKKVQDAWYAKSVMGKFDYLNDRLNSLVPALTFSLQVECRQSVQESFRNRSTEDTKDESRDLRDMQDMVNALGMPSFSRIQTSDLRNFTKLTTTSLYVIYTAKYRLAPVVVKRATKNITNVQKENFLTDTRHMLQFNSEHVVRVLGLTIEQGETCNIVMEHMQLGTLKDVLQTKRDFTLQRLMKMSLEASMGLYFLHCSDVIHRNLTSSKYLVNQEYHVKITGFKYSGMIGTPSTPNHCCKAPEYSSGKYTEKSDVYSFGIILAEILDISLDDVVNECLSHNKPRANAICDRDVVELCKQCVEEDPMLRPTMEDVVQRLSSALDHRQ